MPAIIHMWAVILNSIFRFQLWRLFLKSFNENLYFLPGEASELGSPLDENKGKEESQTSSRGVIPQAKIRTIKMTLVIVLGEYQL